MWLKSSCISCQWRTLHLLAPLVSSPNTLLALCQHFCNACAFKSFKGSRSEASCHRVLSPCHYPGSVLLCVIETVVTVKPAWVNSQEKNYEATVSGSFLRSLCVLTFKISNKRVNLLGGFFGGCYCYWLFFVRERIWKVPLKKKFSNSFCLFLCLLLFYPPGNRKVFLCEISYPYFSLKLCYSYQCIVFSHFSNGFSSLEILFILSPVCEQRDQDLWRRCSCCFVVVRKGNLEFWEYCGGIQKL